MASNPGSSGKLSGAQLIELAQSEGRSMLGEVDAKELVRAWGIPVVMTRPARSAREAALVAGALGFPSVLKMVSLDVVHKTDIGGVKLDLANGEAVERAYVELEAVAAALPAVRFAGVTVQPMVPPGLELLLGASRDPQFGPVISFGLGGVQVEVYDDVALRVAPLSDLDAAEMVEEVRAARLLEGFRGREGVDRNAIRRSLRRLSALMLAAPAVDELDLNPVIGTPQGIVAVDARVILSVNR